MLKNLKKLHFDVPKFSISPSYKKLQPVETTHDGTIVRSSEFVDFDFTQLNAQYTSSDFSIANIIAVGAQQMLNPMMPLGSSAFTMCDQFNNVNYESTQETDA